MASIGMIAAQPGLRLYGRVQEYHESGRLIAHVNSFLVSSTVIVACVQILVIHFGTDSQRLWCETTGLLLIALGGIDLLYHLYINKNMLAWQNELCVFLENQRTRDQAAEKREQEREDREEKREKERDDREKKREKREQEREDREQKREDREQEREKREQDREKRDIAREQRMIEAHKLIADLALRLQVDMSS